MQVCLVSLLERGKLNVYSVENGLEDRVSSHFNVLHEDNETVIVRWQVHYKHLFTVFKLVLWHVVVTCGEPNHHELDVGSQEIRIHFDHEVEIFSLLKHHHFIEEYLPFAIVVIGHGLDFSFEVHILLTRDGVKRNL